MNDQERPHKTRALLIEMRIYVMHHGTPLGECVAWNKLKEFYSVGLDHDDDVKWLKAYRATDEGKGATI